MREKTCQFCGQLFYRDFKDLGNNIGMGSKFCSHRCFTNNRIGHRLKEPLMKICICDKLFIAKQSNRHEKNVCSIGCKNLLNRKWPCEKRIHHGYIFIRVGNKYISEHRFKMENKLQRKLDRIEEIHHLDGNKQNNNYENLIVMNKDEHLNITHLQKFDSLSNGFRVAMVALMAKKPVKEKE